MRIVVTQNGTVILKDIPEVTIRHQRNRILPSNSVTVNTFDDVSEKDKRTFTNEIPINYKSIGLIKKKITIPPSIAERYTEPSEIKDNDASSNIIPNVLTSINRSYISNSSGLPVINSSYALKHIISPSSYKKLENEIEQISRRNKSIKVTEETFRTEMKQDPKVSFNKYTNRHIKIQNKNLIEYLNSDTEISNNFVKKLSNYNDEKLKLLNKISQKAIHNKSQESLIKSIIQKKIKGEYINMNDYYKGKLEEMKDELSRYKKIIKNDYPAVNNRDRYTYQYREAEENWDKYNIERLYKRSSPPKSRNIV